MHNMSVLPASCSRCAILPLVMCLTAPHTCTLFSCARCCEFHHVPCVTEAPKHLPLHHHSPHRDRQDRGICGRLGREKRTRRTKSGHVKKVRGEGQGTTWPKQHAVPERLHPVPGRVEGHSFLGRHFLSCFPFPLAAPLLRPLGPCRLRPRPLSQEVVQYSQLRC